jgi:hypothetical protein
MSDELVPIEIDRKKLKKSALNILAECDKYINFFNQQAIQPPSIKIYQKKYKLLAENLKETGQDIRFAVNRGYRLELYAE